MSYVRNSGVPLGGLGAGKVDLCPDGAIRNVTIQNNLDWPYSGKSDEVDLLSGRKTDSWDKSGLSEAFFATSVAGVGGHMLKAEDLKQLPGVPLEDIDFYGSYPFAQLRYPSLGGVELQLEGFAPILFNDVSPQYLDSSLPTSIFTLSAKNTTSQPQKVCFAFSFPQIVGMGGITHCRITDPRGNVTLEESSDARATIRFGHRKPKINKRVEGEILISTPAGEGVELSSTNGWWHSRLFDQFIQQCKLPDPQGEAVVLTDAGAIHQGSMGAVAATKTLQPGESWSQRFFLAWYFPERPCNDARDGGEPPIYKNLYAGHLKNVGEVLTYVEDNLDHLETETRRWHEALSDSNLPPWFTQKLCNNISHFSTGSIYCADGRGAFNESPVIMNGCMGTIDQRLVSHVPCTVAFPEIAKSELDMFIETQMQADDPTRIAPHWNQKTGQFDAELDRMGSVRHNIGRDDFEGGKTDHTKWLTTHWPDRIPSYIVELYMQAAWTGDLNYLEKVYPSMLAGIEFQRRLDQNGDGIGDLWGNGCCTFDSRKYQHCGASSYVGSLYLAGLRCAQRVARILGDKDQTKVLQKDIDAALATMEHSLWNEEKGQYDKWADPWHASWDDTDRAHPERSTARMTAQLAGPWLTALLDLEPTLEPTRIDRAVNGLYEHNSLPVAGCMSNESGTEDANQQSWPYYAEAFFASTAIMLGKVDLGMEMEEKFANAMAASGRHFDLPLVWQGDERNQPGWGRWYMSTPSSWYILMALSGVWYDGITHTLTIKPRPWSRIGHLKRVPVFHPMFWALVSTDSQGWTIEITLLRTKEVHIAELLSDGDFHVSIDGEAVTLTGEQGRFAVNFNVTDTVTIRGLKA